jgi:hypothetical protein
MSTLDRKSFLLSLIRLLLALDRSLLSYTAHLRQYLLPCPCSPSPQCKAILDIQLSAKILEQHSESEEQLGVL